MPGAGPASKGTSVPLSEDEQRILRDIERTFYENDPEFAGKVRSETLYRHAGRNAKWAALGFLTGLVVLVISFASNVFLGFVGFLLMLGSAFVFERNVRKMGKAGLQQLSQSMRARGFSATLGDTGRRLRERLRKDE